MKPLLLTLLCLGLCQPALPVRTQAAREYILILEDEPVARQVRSRAELRSAQALSHRAKIEQAQRRVRQALAGRNIRVVRSVRTLLNAVFVRASEADLAELRSLPGVKAVVPSKKFKLHMNTAAPLVKAPQAWAALSAAGHSQPGAGMKIAIIDSGIDQNHPAFQDASLTVPAGYPKCVASDCAYTNKKVIVARTYIEEAGAGNTAADSSPDDYSPRDRVGHGTASAMVAAGVENAGPLATIKGIAPKAFLGSYKVFGSPGVNDGAYSSSIVAAIEDALDDGMDVATMSLGYPAWYGPNDTGCYAAGEYCELEAHAVEVAVAQGMVVVVSAGNDGDWGSYMPTLSTVHTPGIAPSAITVGASRNGHEFFVSVSGTGPGAPANVKTLQAVFGSGPIPAEPLAAPLRDVGGEGCTSVPASVNGGIALIKRGTCTFAEKAALAQQAGAVGIIFYCNAACERNGELPFLASGLDDISIPTAMVGLTAGNNLAAYANGHADARATLDPTLAAFADPDSDTIAGFSSRGPSIAPETALKPELVAVGTNVYTATQKYDTNGDMYDSTGYGIFGGTSFSAPMVAGAAALVKQMHSAWEPGQIKSALVNTASLSVKEDGGTAGVLSVGAGKLDAEAAVKTTVTVVPSTLAFGAIPVGGLTGTAALRTFSVSNPGSFPLTITVPSNTADPNRFTLSDSTVPAHQTKSITVTFKPGAPVAGSYTGDLAITGGSGASAVNLHVPYHYAYSDFVPDNVMPLTSVSFDGTVSSMIPGSALLVRVIDRYGIAIEDAPVQWTTSGGASINQTGSCTGADAATALYGVAGACVRLGSARDTEMYITVTVPGGNDPLIYEFSAYPRAVPRITTNPPGVVNNASWQASNGDKTAISPGSYISIFGNDLADSEVHFSNRLPKDYLYLPISLGNVSVSFDSGTISVPGHLTYAGPNQVDVQVPWELAGRSSADMKITLGDSLSNVYNVKLADAAPGIYEADSATSYAAVQHNDTYQLVTAANPAVRGEWLIVYANGLGPVENHPASGEPTPASPLLRTTNGVSVTIGGKAAQVDFAGLTPGSIGLYQANVKVPADAPAGLQPIVITVAGSVSKAARININE